MIPPCTFDPLMAVEPILIYVPPILTDLLPTILNKEGKINENQIKKININEKIEEKK